MRWWRVGEAAALLAALVVLPGRAQTLGEVLRQSDVPLGPLVPFDPDRRITSYAVENGPDLCIVAFYDPGSGEHREDTLRIGVFDRSKAAWVHASLPRRRTAPPIWDVGSVLEIHHSAAHIYLDTHLNPSAGVLIVLTRALRPVAALSGWLLRLLPGDVAVYHRSMVHFAPTHSAEIWTYDARRGRDAALYPRQPYGRVRRAYVDSAAALYARIGDAWFRDHNHGMDPSDFNSSLRGDVVTDGAGTAVAFLMRFGDALDRTPAATPVLDVVVRCDAPGREEARCRETELEPLLRRHPGWTPARLLEAVADSVAFETQGAP